jgi:uncharacterized protein YecE (DUF72 family)
MKMEFVGRKRTPTGGSGEDLVDEVEQDECWMREGEQAMRRLRDAVENTAWQFPPSTGNWMELAKNLLKIIGILIWTMLYHYFFH